MYNELFSLLKGAIKTKTTQHKTTNTRSIHTYVGIKCSNYFQGNKKSNVINNNSRDRLYCRIYKKHNQGFGIYTLIRYLKRIWHLGDKGTIKPTGSEPGAHFSSSQTVVLNHIDVTSSWPHLLFNNH